MTLPVCYLVIGVDPGETAGLAAMMIGDPYATSACQATPDEALCAVEGVLRQSCAVTWVQWRVLLATEEFVVSGRAGRSAHAQAGRDTRALADELRGLARHQAHAVFVSYPAVVVKRWAVEMRLRTAYGLWAATTGQPHARDAARHALYAAVHHGLLTDPLADMPTQKG